MSGEDRFEILVYPETGNGVSTHIRKFIDSSPDNLKLILKEVPDINSAIELLIDGYADIVPVSGDWLYNNRNNRLSSSLVLPRREPTKVLVGENKPEYVPKNGIIVADSELIKRQLLRLRPDLDVRQISDYQIEFNNSFDQIKWLEDLRIRDQIDGYVTNRTLHSSLPSKVRRHTLGVQRQDDVRSRFVPMPLDGYTILLTRSDFPASRFSKVIDFGASLCLRIEMSILDSIELDTHKKIGLFVEQRKIRSIMQDHGNRGRFLEPESQVSEWKSFTAKEEDRNAKDSDSRIDVVIETLNKDGSVTTSVERIFPTEESHTGTQYFISTWAKLVSIAKEKPEEEKRGRMKKFMDDYIDELLTAGRISEDRIYSPLLKEDDY